jgi:OOP family OmpA-OmpF porin
MSTINKFFVLPLSIYLINSFSIYCQNTNKYSVGLSIGTHDGIKNTGDGTTKIYQFHHYNINGRYMLNNRFGIKLDAAFDKFKWTKLDNPTNYYRISIQPTVNLTDILNFSIINKKLGLLLHSGIGFSLMTNKGITDNLEPTSPLMELGPTDNMLHGIIGLTPQYKINERICINADLSMLFHIRQNRTFDFQYKLPAAAGFTGSFINLSIGASYYLGKNQKHIDWAYSEQDSQSAKINELQKQLTETQLKLKDDDGDGILNAIDEDPLTLPGAVVNNKGISLDQQTDTTNELNSNTSQKSELANRDSDNDGVPDATDLCPFLSGSTKGCPDDDFDGVPNIIDACPQLKGSPKLNECEELMNYGTFSIKDFSIFNVYFRLGSSVIDANFKMVLDKFAETIKENENIKIVATGYTDKTGGPAINQKLSKRRVKACVEYLVSKGIQESRFIIKNKIANQNQEGFVDNDDLNRKVSFNLDK